MRDVYRIRLRRHETLGAKPPDDIDCIRPHTSISSPLKACFIEEGKNVEVSDGIDVRGKVIRETPAPSQDPEWCNSRRDHKRGRVICSSNSPTET